MFWSTRCRWRALLHRFLFAAHDYFSTRVRSMCMYSGVWVLFATAHDGNAGGMTPAWVHVHGRPATRAERRARPRGPREADRDEHRRARRGRRRAHDGESMPLLNHTRSSASLPASGPAGPDPVTPAQPRRPPGQTRARRALSAARALALSACSRRLCAAPLTPPRHHSDAP